MEQPRDLNDLASLVNTTPMTVLRALTGARFVNGPIAESVRAAVPRERYADVIATAPTARKRPIAVLASQFDASMIAELIGAIGAEIRKSGYEMLLYSALAPFDDFDNGTFATLRAMCEGVILVMPRATRGFLGALEAANLPAVLVNYCATLTSLPVVQGDNYDSAIKAVYHLLGQGHTRIAFVAGTPYSGQSPRRQAGYEDALRSSGIDIDARYIVTGDFCSDGGARATEQLLDLPDPPTAIFAANDDSAYGVIDTLHKRGLQIPGDMSVVGFDDIIESRYVSPSLTTLRQPLRLIGAEAAHQLVKFIEGHPDACVQRMFATKLVKRESSGPAPRSVGAGLLRP